MADTKEPKYKIKVPKMNMAKKTYEFALSLPGMITAVGAGVLALTFFFVMGILIGRGYRPEADIPQLEPIMPSHEHGQIADAKQPPTVLTPEELEYPERLKDSAAQIMDQTPAKPAKATPAQPEKPKSEAAKPKVTTPAKAETIAPTPAKTGEPVFDYVYQVAAFKKADMAEAFSKKLVASGLRTTIVKGDAKGSTWHRVQVLYHGTAASTDEMKAVLAKHGIKKPLLKKKTSAQ